MAVCECKFTLAEITNYWDTFIGLHILFWAFDHFCSYWFVYMYIYFFILFEIMDVGVGGLKMFNSFPLVIFLGVVATPLSVIGLEIFYNSFWLFDCRLAAGSLYNLFIFFSFLHCWLTLLLAQRHYGFLSVCLIFNCWNYTLFSQHLSCPLWSQIIVASFQTILILYWGRSWVILRLRH